MRIKVITEINRRKKEAAAKKEESLKKKLEDMKKAITGEGVAGMLDGGSG